MHDILTICGMLALCIWFIQYAQKEQKKHLELATEAIAKGIDCILPDGRRVFDESIECTIPHEFVRHMSAFAPGKAFLIYTGRAEVIAFHKLKDGTWLRQDATCVGSKGLRNRRYTPVEEKTVRSALAEHPDQFIKAFGEPVVV